MSADLVRIQGRFKLDDTSSYTEIRDELIEGLSEHLSPEAFPLVWEEFFEVDNDYLELYIDNTYGNWGKAQSFIEQEFIKKHPKFLVEFCCVEYYYPDIFAEKLFHDGFNTTKGYYGVNLEDCNNLTCPKCECEEYYEEFIDYEHEEEGKFICPECEYEFEFDFEDEEEKLIEEFEKEIRYELVK